MRKLITVTLYPSVTYQKPQFYGKIFLSPSYNIIYSGDIVMLPAVIFVSGYHVTRTPLEMKFHQTDPSPPNQSIHAMKLDGMISSLKVICLLRHISILGLVTPGPAGCSSDHLDSESRIPRMSMAFIQVKEVTDC